MFRPLFMTKRQNLENQTPADLGFPCRRNGNGTRPPGSAGRTIPPIGPVRSIPSAGFTAKWCERLRRAKSFAFSSIIKRKRNWRAAYLGRAGVRYANRCEFVTHPTNRGWTRDSGPIFVRNGKGRKKAETAIVHFHFNAWAKYDDWQKDRRVPETAARLLGKRLFNAEYNGKDFVIEGGGIEVNGRGHRC